MKINGVDIEDYNTPYSEWEMLIGEWIFNKTTREIVSKHWLDGVSIKELAEEYNTSERNVCKMLQKGEKALAKHIK